MLGTVERPTTQAVYDILFQISIKRRYVTVDSALIVYTESMSPLSFFARCELQGWDGRNSLEIN